jgi:hypothetical protein
VAFESSEDIARWSILPVTPNPLRIEVTRRGHFYPLFKEASQRCFRGLRVYRVLLQREGGERGKRRDARAWLAPCGQDVETPYG